MRACVQCGLIYKAAQAFCSRDGQPIREVKEDPMIGRRLGGYDVVGIVGIGGLGRVYRVVDRETGGVFAAKLMYGDHASNASFIRRFHREVRALSRLDHPNIVTIYDADETETGTNFMVMDLIEGLSLSQVIRRDAPMDTARIVEIVRQLAAGLAAAHDAGFVHRDLKPGNIMVTPRSPVEHVRILDFGIVALADRSLESVKLTARKMAIGTPHYMAPEQTRDSEVGVSADLYSLGVILYELVAGGRPFDGTSTELLAQHEMATPAALPQAGGLGPLAMWLLEKRPESRPSSAQEVLLELDQTGTSGSTRAIVPVKPPRPNTATTQIAARGSVNSEYDSD